MTHQRGGTVLGFVLGVVFGLAVALAVAIYVTKVPVPFVSKALGRDPAQDINEQQKNKNWDPNAPLYGKNPIKPDGPPEELVPRLPPGDAPAPATKTSSTKPPSPAPSASAPAKEFKPAVTADPLGDLAKARAEAPKGSASSGSKTADPFTYFVQVGAFRTAEDAETQRAKLSLAGIETKVSERQQAGSLVHRVRVGPFDTREAAEKSRNQLNASGIEAALVRVQN